MNKKILFVFGVTVLLIGIMLLPCVNAHNNTHRFTPNIAYMVQLKQGEKYEHVLVNESRVYGLGMCYGIYVNGNPYNGLGRNKRLIGKIKANLTIRNNYPIPPTRIGSIIGGIIGSKIKIEELETGETYTFNRTPSIYYISLLNFDGYGFIDDHHKGWGPNRAIFYLRGTADKVEVY